MPLSVVEITDSTKPIINSYDINESTGDHSHRNVRFMIKNEKDICSEVKTFKIAFSA